MKSQSILIVILFINTLFQFPIVSAQVTNYTNEFVVNGEITIIGVGQFDISGIYEISMEQINNIYYYINDFEASFGGNTENGYMESSEYIENKTIPEPLDKSSFFYFIWQNFSNDGERPLYSPYRITNQEISMNNFQLLNYTSMISQENRFYSPYLGYSIHSRIVTLQMFDYEVNFYFDTNYGVLIGIKLNMLVESEEGQRIIIDVNVVISKTTLNLPIADNRTLQLTMYIIVSLIILVILVKIIKTNKSKEHEPVIEGGI